MQAQVHVPKINPTPKLMFGLKIGFFAGLIWGGVHHAFWQMNFTQVIPGYMADPFFKKDFLAGAGGHLVGWLFFIGFSIIAALLYTFLLYKLKGPWPGVGYGILWWAVIFFAIGPLTGMVPWFGTMSYDTYLVELSLYLLWGIFIGYTIAFEYNDERSRDAKTS